VDATLIGASPSTKNTGHKRDPDMRSSTSEITCVADILMTVRAGLAWRAAVVAISQHEIDAEVRAALAEIGAETK
jgi:hypothetical protein